MPFKIFRSKILSYFDYGDQLSCSAAHDTLQDLQYAQNRCLTICLKVDHLTDTNWVHEKSKFPMLHRSSRQKTHLVNFHVQEGTWCTILSESYWSHISNPSCMCFKCYYSIIFGGWGTIEYPWWTIRANLEGPLSTGVVFIVYFQWVDLWRALQKDWE